MSENDNEILEQTEDADTTKENESVSGLDPKTLLAQKEHFKSKLAKAEVELEETKKKLDSFNTFNKTTEEKTDNSRVSEERLEAIEFAISHPEIDPKISTEILEVARAKGIKPSEAVDLPYFKAYLEKQSEEKASSSSVPPSSRSLKYQAPKPVSEMTPEEHKKFWEQNK